MNRYKEFTALGLIGAVLLSGNAVASVTLTDVHQLDVKQINKQYQKANTAMEGKAPKLARQRHAEMLRLEVDTEFAQLTHAKDRIGQYYRYQQTFRGIPVFGKQILVSEDSKGNVRSLFGHRVSGLSKELPVRKVKISALRALNFAKRAGLGQRQPLMKIEGESVKQMIYLDQSNNAHMTYVVSYFAETSKGDNATQPLVVIDAYTGKVIDQWDELPTALIGTGPGGNLKSGLIEYGSNLNYIDVAKSGDTCIMRNPKVRTLDFNNATSGGVVHSYICPRNYFRPTNGALSPLNDAHYYGTNVYNMYNTYLGKPPLPFQISLRVHYGSNFNNARWKAAARAVEFGDGNANRYPWTVMDIVAHEISHGFTSQYSGLIYKGQSGGMNEAFSDMGGEAFKHYMTGSNDFLFGKNVVKGNGALRNMANPPLDGKSIAHASNYVDGMNVHYSSGVYNKAFYLLTQKTGWDVKKAFQLFARANDLYWASDSTFNQGACGVEQASMDLGFTTEDVSAAFNDVGVSCGLLWDVDTAIGLYGGPLPTFWDSRKTVSTGFEPADGMYGIASRATVYRNSGKRYVEVTFLEHTASAVFPYSGQICLSLRDRSVPVSEGAGMQGDWAICWFTDAETTPAAVAPPWFRTKTSLNAVVWGPPLNPGPLDAWRITQGDTIGIAADMNTGKIWYSLNGVWVGDPATGAQPNFDQSLYSSEAHFSGKSITPHLFTHFQNVRAKIRGGAGEMLYPVPAGFTAWGE